ncbi:MAG: energy-coupling factor ABC transporter permease, partial [bacterium]
MHIPNGFLDPKVSAGAAFAAAGVLGYCIAKVRQALSAAVPEAVFARVGNMACTVSNRSAKLMSSFAEDHLMRMGAIGSLIFAAQMFNFPVNSGTSGHLLGGIIAAIALGPFSGSIVIAVVLAVQSIFFADGGIMALGANILNMAIIGTLACYYIYYFINKMFRNEVGAYAGVFLSAFFSVLLASIA